MAATAVDEGMDLDQTVVEPESKLVWFKHLLGHPEVDVGHERSCVDCHLGRIDAEIGLFSPVEPGPSPDLSEHREVEPPEVQVVEQLVCAWTQSVGCRRDVGFLGRVQLAPGGDAGRNQVARSSSSISVCPSPRPSGSLIQRPSTALAGR